MTVNSAALAASQSMQMVQWNATQSSFALEALGVPTSASPKFESLFRGRQNRGQALRKGWLWGGGSALSQHIYWIICSSEPMSSTCFVFGRTELEVSKGHL